MNEPSLPICFARWTRTGAPRTTSPSGQIYLLDNPLLREPLDARAHQAAPARPLGHDARAQLHLRAPQPRHHASATSTRSTSSARATAARASSRTRTSRGPTARSTRTSPRTRTGCSGCSGSSRSPAASRATSRPRRPAPSTRAASSATRSPRVRRGVRQPRPRRVLRRRRRRGRDRPARDELALEQVPRIRRRDGAVLPILHLNGYKIANPTVLARIPHEELERSLRGYGWEPRFVEGDDPRAMHQQMAATLDDVSARSARIQTTRARGRRDASGRAGR